MAKKPYMLGSLINSILIKYIFWFFKSLQKCHNKTSYVSWNICIAYHSKNRGNCLELGNNPLFLVETLKGWSIQCTCAYHSSLSLGVLSWILILLSTADSLVAGATILLSKARHFMNDKRSIPLRKINI